MSDKYDAELAWWTEEVDRRMKEAAYREVSHAMWAEQANYYPGHLDIPDDYNCGRLLDVGAGPILPARRLKYDELWCVDPLFARYAEVGFPVRESRAILLPFHAENMWGIPSGFFDTVVSVNAMDHVDNFEQAVAEIRRVAKPTALIRLRLTYHPPTETEPMQLSDKRAAAAFAPFGDVSQLLPKIVHDQALWGNQRGLTRTDS
jgi:SAM-dependent methyltransferase